MREWTGAEWRREWEETPGAFAVFVHTPLCGTCKAVRRMLGVAAEILPDIPLAEANVNLMPDMAQALLIESVPCLILKRKDGTWTKIYRFPSVTELVGRLRSEMEMS